MAINVNLGGDRLGSGNKMNVELKNYSRSTHNLTKKFRSTMAPGVLYPAYILPALVGDDIDIDINAMIKTLPTNGPLMGTFKFQADVFQCPIRLYQGLLHNNTLNMGLNMKNVLLPKMRLITDYNPETTDFTNCQINPTSLVKYCGISGIGVTAGGGPAHFKNYAAREFSGLPILMYYDIFKNYYANKQEEKAYVITGEITGGAINPRCMVTSEDITTGYVNTFELEGNQKRHGRYFYPRNWYMEFTGEYLENIGILIDRYNEDREETFQFRLIESELEEIAEEFYGNGITLTYQITKNKVKLEFVWYDNFQDGYDIAWQNTTTVKRIGDDVILQSFDLENIDKMRRLILSKNELGDQILLGDKDETDFLPYSIITDLHENGEKENEGNNLFGMNGLCIKTYQSDLFNNWINTEWIDGDNGVNAISKVQVEDGAFTIDALNLAQKVYNLLNRIVTCDGTYQAWQSAVSGQEVSGHYETPLYCGGMSSEIVFEEIASSAASGDQPLGTLAGRGKMDGRKGGNLTIHVNELSYIMVIISITPRIDYYQGNKWFMTDIDTVDDFHKPALDGIGFQDLIGEQMAWWDSKIYFEIGGNRVDRTTVGKVPAWINYMTDTDEVYGDFAKGDGKNFMVLGRSYDMELDENDIPIVKDFTTYIDPAKFNYAFTDASRNAQNFWCQMLFDVKARRIMSAKMIPNL